VVIAAVPGKNGGHGPPYDAIFGFNLEERGIFSLTPDT
jgi:hypothetical protein